MNYFPILLSGIFVDAPAAVNLLIVLNIILISIILIFLIVRVLLPVIRKSLSEREEKAVVDESVIADTVTAGSDTEAAIAAALYLYFNEMHDEESDVITVKRVSKTYSPWSSKLYSMRNLR